MLRTTSDYYLLQSTQAMETDTPLMYSQQEELGYYFQVGLHTYYTIDKREIMYHK